MLGKVGVRLVLGAGLLAMAAAPARAQQSADTYPSKTVTIIVPAAPGSGSDYIGRLVAQELQALWKQPVVVSNVAAAAGTVGSEQLKRAEADGYTLGMLSNAVGSVLPAINKEPRYDPSIDFVSVAAIASGTNMLAVNSTLPVNNFKEFVEFAKKQPGVLNYASAGIGSNQHVFMEALMAQAGINLTHVPYVSGGAAVTALSTNTVQAMITAVLAAQPVLQNKTVKLIASTSTRHPDYPDVPTLAEVGLAGYDLSTWTGFFAPKDTPPAIVAKIYAGVQEAFKKPSFNADIKKGGLDPWPGSGEEMHKRVKADLDLFRRLSKERNIYAQ